MGTDVLTINSLTYTYPGTSIPALQDVSCAVHRGECLCLTGNSGCGKTTLLLAIKRLLHGGKYTGTIELNVTPGTGSGSSPIGLVFQNAESQILCTTVAEEVAFGPENLCIPAAEIARRIRTSLQGVGLTGYEARHVERFSAGQKQRLAIAAVLSMQPALLMLDEPTSQLDGKGKEELAELLVAIKQQGYTIIMAEHDPRPFTAIIDRYLTMDRGRITAASAIPPNKDLHTACYPIMSKVARAQETPTVTFTQELSLAYPETGPALKDVNLRLKQGERVLLFGSNGAGKSSLLRCLAGLEEPDSGTIELAGIGSPRPEKLPGKVGVLFQNPVRQLFAESVYDEVAFTLCRLGYDRQETERVVAEVLDLCSIAHLAERVPLTLSFGEQHRVALAAVVAPRPALLLLDEPFAGLDIPQRLGLLTILAEMSERYGTTVLIASHDELPDKSWADRTLVMHGGDLVETAS
jgi:energy-coupling factor transport system ATP-binding protein